ncbi:HNH endonuclease [Deinococcus lacus]|uniref:HNH endonuclease n=1 Tax=Deinococcus lacus TaxID=392561 RepID=A0ABW1YCK0_9DEIO
MPLSVDILMLAATSESQRFSQMQPGSVQVTDTAGNALEFRVTADLFANEQAVILLELYRKAGVWRATAVGQGFDGGLQALLESLGGEVAEESRPQPTAAPPSAPQPWQPLEDGNPLHQSDSGRCRRCGKEGNLLNRLTPEGLCKSCAREVREGLERFRLRFLAASADGVMELHEWQDLQRTLTLERLGAQQALEFVRADALALMERTLALARADGEITEQEEADFDRLADLLELPGHFLTDMRRQMEELKLAAEYRKGHLPTIQSTLILDAGEVAHLECDATYQHVTATRTRDIPGRLVVTNQKVHFISETEGGWNVQYGKVLRIQELPDGVGLELGVKKGSGRYRQVAQPLMLSATLDALVRMHKRLLLMPQTERASRSIPQKVKLEVWQRDQGKCVECGDTNYLEFDHVIPHSKGGATSVANLQLLCRRCNLAKGDRL